MSLLDVVLGAGLNPRKFSWKLGPVSVVFRAQCKRKIWVGPLVQKLFRLVKMVTAEHGTKRGALLGVGSRVTAGMPTKPA